MLAIAQRVSELDNRKTPIWVPAKRYPPETASDNTDLSMRPALTAVQLVPLLVERNTPPPLVPANRFVPETASDKTQASVKPESTAHH